MIFVSSKNDDFETLSAQKFLNSSALASDNLTTIHTSHKSSKQFKPSRY